MFVEGGGGGGMGGCGLIFGFFLIWYKIYHFFISLTSQVLSQRFSQSVGLSSHGNQEEESSGVRGAEVASNTITVLSKYGYYGNITIYKLGFSSLASVIGKKKKHSPFP